MNKLFYLIIISMMNFLYAECSDIENQTECEAVGCEWTESDNMPGGYCTGEWEDDEEEFEGCSEIDNQEECERVEGCEWSENAGCIEGEWGDDEDGDDNLRCEDIENQTECEAVGCEWTESDNMPGGYCTGEWEDDGGILEEEVIEGRWIPGGFGNTMYEFVDGLRYTYYCDDYNNVCDSTYWNSLDTSNAIPNPNPYTVEENTISINLFYGTIATYTIGFKCDGQVVDFYYDEDDWIEGLHSTMFREDFDYINSECDICSIYDEEYCSWLPFCQWDYDLDFCLDDINNSIEGRWHLVGYEDNVMYQFVDTEPFADAGLRYTIYSTDGNFDDLDGDYTGGTPNPYIVAEDIITIDLHFGNEPSYQMNFKCDGQVVELIDIEFGLPNSILFRENYDYNDCSSYPNECFDLSSVDFGECEMILGVGWNGYECEYISGCGWIVDGIDYSEYFYDSSFDCQESCWCEDGEFNNDNPCNPMECVNGQWLQIVIDCAEEMGVPCEDGVYISPPADECCSTCVLFGDSNYDGTLNILDITILIGTILYEGQCADWFECPEDFNQDGTLNILDIIELVNVILD